MTGLWTILGLVLVAQVQPPAAPVSSPLPASPPSAENANVALPEDALGTPSTGRVPGDVPAGPQLGAPSVVVPPPLQSPLLDSSPQHLGSGRPLMPDHLPMRTHAEQVQRAARMVLRGQYGSALRELEHLDVAAAQLVKARALRGLQKWTESEAALEKISSVPWLAPLWQLEDGLLAAARQDPVRARERLLPLVLARGDEAGQAVVALLPSMARSDPNFLLARADDFRAVLPASDGNAKSLFLQSRADAAERAGRVDDARALRVQCFVQEPVSPLTPATPPEGVTLDIEQWLERAQRLLEANRNDRALTALASLDGRELPPAAACRAAFTRGLAQRKQRRYAAAEEALTKAGSVCTDDDLLRRAAYLRIKVISIRDGLRAIEPIEAFAQAYPRHTMTDDVLFWAGDMYQRRNRFDEARQYYQRVDALPVRDDFCAESRFRLGWMHLKQNNYMAAVPAFERMLTADGCVNDPVDQAQARYWLGWVYEQTGARDKAQQMYQLIWDTQPLSFYAQLALPRFLALQPEKARETLSRKLMAPGAKSNMGLCPAGLAEQPDFARALTWLQEGLGPDAARILLRLSPSAARVVGTAQAASLGERTQVAERAEVRDLRTCGPAQAALLLVLLLDKAGAQHEAHWRLRTVFGDEFGHFPTPEEMVLWRAAYPLAFRDAIGAAEHESRLPKYFLQALSREESAFDPLVVSWAEAYGLTQLLLTSAQDAGRRLQPPVRVTDVEQLLDATYNARLGGALLGWMLRHFQGNAALALTAYNAGNETGNVLWQRYQHQYFSVYAEELPIQETRGYVKRVLRTFGIYRWLYASALPSLAIEPTLPVKP